MKIKYKTYCWIENNKWKVLVSKNNQEEEELEFDGLLICNGHHNIPRIPKFEGQENFEGKIVHSHSYKHPEPYKNKKVLVVGIGIRFFFFKTTQRKKMIDWLILQ